MRRGGAPGDGARRGDPVHFGVRPTGQIELHYRKLNPWPFAEANWAVPREPDWHGYGQNLIILRIGEVVARVKNDLANEILYADLPIPKGKP